MSFPVSIAVIPGTIHGKFAFKAHAKISEEKLGRRGEVGGDNRRGDGGGGERGGSGV